MTNGSTQRLKGTATAWAIVRGAAAGVLVHPANDIGTYSKDKICWRNHVETH